MSLLKFLLCALIIHGSCQNVTTPNSLDTANNYLRSFLPWWPQVENITMKATPIGNNFLSNTTTQSDDSSQENGTLFEDYNDELVDPSTLEVQEIPRSPLDELAPSSSSKSTSGGHHGNFIINFEEMGECPRDCSAGLRDALGIVLKDMSHIERYHRICEKYKNATTCVSEDVRCDNDDRGMFEMTTSGLRYMCVEQQLAFNATIQCIDNEAGLVQAECENQCQTKFLFMNWIMRSAMQSTIQQGVNGIVGAATGTNPNPLAFLQGAEGAAGQTGWADMLGKPLSPPSPQSAIQGFENFRAFTNDLCKVGDCMLDCIRSKFNTRCEGSAGTLLSEVFVRPIASSQDKLMLLRPVLGMFLPEQCSYLHNNADLRKHRIDSTMDGELKRMYSEKAAKEIRERAEQDELLASLVPLDENGVPLPRALPELKPVQSPLDINTKVLNQLIIDTHKKKENRSLKVSAKNVTSTPRGERKDNSTMTTTTTKAYESQELSSTTTATTTIMTTSSDSSRTQVVSTTPLPTSSAEPPREERGETLEESTGSSRSHEESAEIESSVEGSGEASEEPFITYRVELDDDSSGDRSDEFLKNSETRQDASGKRSGEFSATSSGDDGFLSGTESSGGESAEASGGGKSYGEVTEYPFSISDKEDASGSGTPESSGYLYDDVSL